MKRKYGPALSNGSNSYKIYKPYKKRAYVSMPLGFSGIGPLNRKNNIFKQYASTSYKSGEEVRSCDFKFTGAWAMGVYTPDTEPFETLTCNTTGCIQSLSNLQQGVGIANRTGNKASLKSVRIRLNALATGKFYTNLNHARIILFYDRQPNGAYLSPTDFLSQVTSANVIVAGTMQENLNVNYMDRIRILRDEYVTLPVYDNGALVDQVGPTVMDSFQMDWYVKLKDLELVYKATSNPGVIANSTVGSLQILIIGDVVANSEPWCFTGSARLRFRNN